MELNRELKWICTLLEEGGVDYWIDCGTLLGLAREGRIMKGDHDIDLSMWAFNEPALEKILPAAEERGYRVSVKNYRGLNFKYKLSPRVKNSSLDIDISLFRPAGEHAWCPQVYCLPYPYNKKNPLYYFYAAPRRLIQEIFIRKKRVYVHRFPWPLSYTVYLVWVPKRYFAEKVLLYDSIPAPKDYKDYLRFRYGEWKVPREKWDFIFDDGAIRHVSPERMVENF